MFVLKLGWTNLSEATGRARQIVRTNFSLFAPQDRACAHFWRITPVLLGALVLAAQATAEIAIKIEIAERSASLGQCSFLVSVSGSPTASAGELRQRMKLEMPGFSDIHISEAERDKLRVTAKILRPGFYPFQISLSWRGEDLIATDYFVSELNSEPRAFDHIGYYVFLGRGDFWDETQELALWTLQDWESLADWMFAHHADTLYMLLNGYTLAYPSEKYRSLRDPFSTNARYGFLRPFIDYAHGRGIRVFLVLTTDDHAEGFGNLYPEVRRVNRFGYAPASRALALEEPKVRQYIEGIFEEALTLYGNADGVVFHPSEEDPDRFNVATRTSYRKDTGKELATASKAERYRWYNQKFAELLASLSSKISERNPNLEFVMFNTWWQDEYANLYREMLKAKFKVCVWFYDEKEEKVFSKWPIWNWTEAFGAERIIYMPSGEAFLYPQEPAQQLERHIRVDRLVSAAHVLDVKTCVFFAGWNLGSDFDRRRDLAIAWFPTVSHVRERSRALELLPQMYTNYFSARAAVFK
jgi:hypothetical protein